MLHNQKELAAEAEDDAEILSDFIPRDDSENSNKSKDCIITDSIVIPFIRCQTGYNSATIVKSFANLPRKNNRYNKKTLGAIGKREYENDVVWITLKARHFKWKKANIPKVKGDGIDTMYIFYANPYHRGSF